MNNVAVDTKHFLGILDKLEGIVHVKGFSIKLASNGKDMSAIFEELHPPMVSGMVNKDNIVKMTKWRASTRGLATCNVMH